MNYNEHKRKKRTNEETTDQPQQQSQLNVSKYQSIEYPFRRCYFYHHA